MDFATVTPSLVICWAPAPSQRLCSHSCVCGCTCLGTAKGLLDDDIAALGTEGDRDGFGEDVDALEETGAALVAEADVLQGLTRVSATVWRPECARV